VELPAAARSDVRQILNFDLERATPFRLKDVYTAHVVEGEAGAKGKLRVSQMVAKREAIDPLVADVEATGLEVAFVDCWQDQPSAGLGVDFLEQSAPEAAAQGLVTPPRALAALALVLAVSAVAIILSKHESALEDVQARAAKMRAQAATVRGVLERSDAAVADLARLQQMKLKQIPAIEVLEEVTRVLPDSVWLTDLRMEGDTLDVSGLAKSGAALLSLFERSAIFADAALTAPLTLDQREDKERFSLRIRIKQPMTSRPLAKEEQQ
jgi:general secretion pathway protein L